MRGVGRKMGDSMHGLYRAYRRLFTVPVIFLCLFFYPDQAMAEPDAIIYENSITLDEEEDKLLMPSFVMIDQKMNELYVVDGRNRVMIYSQDLFPLHMMNSESGIESPHGLALDDEGYLYVAQSSSNGDSRHRISVFKPCLRKDRDIYIQGFEGAENFFPYRLAVDKNGNIFVSSSHYKGVLILNNEGILIDTLSPAEQGQNVTLTNVTIDNAGRIYLVSEDAGRVYIYDKNRTMIAIFGEKGGSSGKLSRPKSVAIDSNNGKMFVVDYMRHTITVYSSSGSYLHEFGGLGLGAGWFQNPIDAAMDNEGRLFVADYFNHRVEIFKTR